MTSAKFSNDASPTARTKAVFSSTAATYDTARARLIPRFTEFYAAAVCPLPDHTTHVLDLGAGTGLLSAFIRERFPEAHLHLVDNSEPMLAQARERFRHNPQTTFELADYNTLPLEPATYDAITSALSIHHLTDDAKRALFARLLPGLKSGGVFLNAEQVRQPTPELEEEAKQRWLADIRALGATESQIADSLLRQTEDRCATVADQLTWLREAGFTEVQCTFDEGRFAVLTGRRPLSA